MRAGRHQMCAQNRKACEQWCRRSHMVMFFMRSRLSEARHRFECQYQIKAILARMCTQACVCVCVCWACWCHQRDKSLAFIAYYGQINEFSDRMQTRTLGCVRVPLGRFLSDPLARTYASSNTTDMGACVCWRTYPPRPFQLRVLCARECNTLDRVGLALVKRIVDIAHVRTHFMGWRFN